MIQLFWMSVQAENNAAQAFPKGELAKTQTQELLPAWEGFDIVVAAVGGNAFLKLISGQ